MRNFFISVLLVFLFTSIIYSWESTKGVTLSDSNRVRVEPWISDLEIPWSLIFLPDGRALVSERPGRIRLIKEVDLR